MEPDFELLGPSGRVTWEGMKAASFSWFLVISSGGQTLTASLTKSASGQVWPLLAVLT